MDINVIVEQMLKDKNIEKEIWNVCKKSNDDYFYSHYDGELAEYNLFDYCLRAKHNRHARDILKQVVRYCGEKSLSARFFRELVALPQKDFKTCCHYLAHCPLSFLQKYNIFLKQYSSEILVDLLSDMCTQERYTDDDIQFLMTYYTGENVEAILYFIKTFDGTTDANIKRKLAIINTTITNRVGK